MRADQRFREAAEGMCSDGRLPRDAFTRYRRLLIQNGAGATETAIYENEGAPPTIVFQYVFEEGTSSRNAAIPELEDVQAGLLCWHAFNANAQLCDERRP